LIDYIVSFGLATNALLIIPIGLVFAGVYFVLFTASIRVFNLETLGRERIERAPRQAEPAPA